MSQPPFAPPVRVRVANPAPVRPDGRYVLYWMIAARRSRSSFALQHAVARAHELRLPLVVFEPLRLGYPHASERLHRFVMDGMVSQQVSFAGRPVTYLPWLEERAGDGRGLLAALAAEAACVVTDEFPAFFLPRMVAAASERLDVRLEVVDGNGLVPLRSTDRAWGTAYAFRRFVQRNLRTFLDAAPVPDPLADVHLPRLNALPAVVTRRWPGAGDDVLSGAHTLARWGLDHRVRAAPTRGGEAAGRAAVATFVDERLPRYLAHRDDPDDDATSGLSPYLHFGHLSAHEVFDAIAGAEAWRPQRLGHEATGAREGFWGMGADAEAFLDQLVTWRELGLNFCAHRSDADRWDGLPGWSRASLLAHVSDPRPALYAFEQLENAETGDELWNAAQRQLLAEGRIHNRLRMLWGKLVIAWTRDPREAWDHLVRLNDKWALDGRDPNSYSGIGWCFGRYDRPWAPERPIYGTVRLMTSASARRKHRMKAYLERYGPQTALL